MEYQQLGSTDMRVSRISFGTWAIGGSWGAVDRTTAREGLAKAMDLGVNFFDTADVYGDGRAEQLLNQATRGREQTVMVATKFGRGGDYTNPQNYKEPAVREFCEASLRRLGRERIDLYQIHCPPTWVIEQGDVFEVLDRLQREGKIRYYGVSVETVDEGLKALRYPGVKALQVIYNIFRQKPRTELFEKAQEAGVGILARLPLASGLLSGKFTADHVFEADDHRNFNRNGEQFNVGETFAGLPFEKGVELARQLGWIAEERGSMVKAALRYILDTPGVTCAIPGFKTAAQVEENAGASDVPPFTQQEQERLSNFYHAQVKPWIRGRY